MSTHYSQDATPEDRVPFDPSDRGLLLGDGVFDTSLVHDGRVILLDAHIARLMGSAEVLGLEADEQEIRDRIAEIIPTDGLAALRITLTRGPGGRGLSPAEPRKPTLIVRATPLAESMLFAPTRLTLSSLRRNPYSLTSRHKTLSYVDNVAAMREAKQAGFDDALMLNTDGRLASTSCANIFVGRGRTLFTPPLGDGVLPGVMRGWLLEHAARAGFSVEERSLTMEDVSSADTVFTTNSLRLVSPVTQIGGTRIGIPYLAPLHNMVRTALFGIDMSD